MFIKARIRGLEEQKLWRREAKGSYFETQRWPWTRKHSLTSPTPTKPTKICCILHHRSLLLNFPQATMDLDCSTLYPISKTNKILRNLEISSHNFFLCSSHHTSFSFFLTLIIRKPFECLWNFNFSSCEEFFSHHKLWMIACKSCKSGFLYPGTVEWDNSLLVSCRRCSALSCPFIPCSLVVL